MKFVYSQRECFAIQYSRLGSQISRRHLPFPAQHSQNRKRTLEFRNTGTEGELKQRIQALFDKAKGKGRGSMVFLTEGQSAAGSIVSCRDVNTQAIFVLKGKPLNVWDLKRDIVYKNDEMYNLMRGLDIEDGIQGLRYEKVILATDADVDGLHIRNLMITYFFRFFEQLVHDGHLFVLETPLFRVRNKQKTIYCYSEAERDDAAKQLGESCEITRFKGLGEISPNEFKQFIGQEMRLSQVEYAPKPDSQQILGFYMGKNTPERKDYIMANLVVPVEE